MSLLRFRNVRLGFGGPLLFAGLDLQIEARERVCLVGRNGCGKSTLLKLLAGIIQADEGDIERRQNCRIALLDQELPDRINGSIYDVVASGLGIAGELIQRFHHLSMQVADDPELLPTLESVQHDLEAQGGWEVQQRVDTVLSKLSLDADAGFDQLSGGLQRRVLLARALVNTPDILLLDEPTNHLDIQSIEWLEEFLLGFNGSLLFVTHDRRFLTRLATRIIDLDRGVLTSWPGDYPTYLRRKEEWLATEAEQQAVFDKKLAREETWIRQGIKARRTRNEGRVRALKKLREQRLARRNTSGSAKMQSQEFERSGKRVIEARQISYSIDNRSLITHLSTTILRGDKIGIIGPNGVGKTTLLRLLLGELQPDSGEVCHGTKLEIGYFDQRRMQLDEQRSVLDNISDGRQSIEVNGQPRHVISYLQDFLFAPDRVRQPVSALSGGERNRLMLARLFSKPSNLLVLDEPTNDLDIDTLDLLEELLMNYAGSILLVSHDRAFLDQVVTSTLVFEGNAQVKEYVGGYDDWLRQYRSDNTIQTSLPVKTPQPAAEKKTKPAKLGFRDQRELDQLPARIESLERRQEQLHKKMADPAYYKSGADEIAAVRAEVSQIEQELEIGYARWEELEQSA